MGWFFVLFAAASEMVGVIGLKLYSQHKTFKNGVFYLCGFGASFAFLYTAFKYLQVSIAYAVWTGIGTAGAVILNMIFFGESKGMTRIVSLILIVIGVTGLKTLS